MLKKILFLFLLFLFCPCTIRAKTVVALGDSITTGYGVEKNESYVSIFCKELEVKVNEKTKCINLAINGLTSQGLIDILHVDETGNEIKNADYLLMSIGGNDFLKELTSNLSIYLNLSESYPQVSSVGKTLFKNITSILDEITSINPHLKIFIVPLYNPYVVIMNNNLVLMDSFNSIKKEYVKLVQKYPQVIIKENLSKILEKEEYINVSFEERNIDPHPNRLGHDAIAREMVKEIDDAKSITVQKQFDFYTLVICLITIFLLFGIGIVIYKKW